jgi:hypothetical protein
LGTAVYSDAPDNSAKLVDAIGQSFSATIATITAGPDFPGSVTIGPGNTGLGFVVFDVPASSIGAKVQFTLDSGFARQTGEWLIRGAPAANSTAAQAPANVVINYFAAINSGDYRLAWSLGGDNLDPSYDHFAAGFAGTKRDTVTVLSTTGDTVRIQLDAEQSDGSHRSFSGTYTVRGGVIVGADVQAD